MAWHGVAWATTLEGLKAKYRIDDEIGLFTQCYSTRQSPWRRDRYLLFFQYS